MRSKYGSKKKTVDGYQFDSTKEADRYKDLKIMEKMGVIDELRLQPEFELQPGFVHEGKKIRPIKYIADFAYISEEGPIVEDVKSSFTKTLAVYRMKKKMLLYTHPNIKFQEYE